MTLLRSRMVTGGLVIAAIMLIAGPAWAIYYALGPSKDEWGLKYDIAIEEANKDSLTVRFTLANEGRLKPIHSITLAVLDKANSSKNSRRYDVRGKLEMKAAADGKRAGEIQLRKDQADQAMIRILTQRVDGKFQSGGARYYDIPLDSYLNGGSSPDVAARPSSPGAKTSK